jgi:uncharacterized protein YndB with AHSA1/START domain
MTIPPKSNEIKITRFLEAPVSAVWDAWTDDQQVSQWWGPRGFTIKTHSKDLKVGGHWHYTMFGPDGATYVNKTRYLEVENQAKLVYDHGGNDEKKPLFRVTVTFKSVKGGTLMDMIMACPTPEDAVQTRGFIKKAGGNSTWDRFSEYLHKKLSGKETFVINRSFDVPIEKMWDLWTSPDHFSKWLPPTGFTMKFLEADIRSGGKTVYSMTALNGGMTMYGRTDYITLEKPHTLIYTQQFTDEKGNVSRHPMAPTWPETMKTHVSLTEEGPKSTRVTITWEVIGQVTQKEMDTFINGRTGMTQGWTGSFDKLDDYLVTFAKG